MNKYKKALPYLLLVLLILIVTVIIMILISTRDKSPKQYTVDNTVLSSDTDNDFCGGYFTKINHWADVEGNYYIVYANDTKVKYFVYVSAHRLSITPLYNADGTLQIKE